MQKSPWFFLITMALSVFCAENEVMLLFLVLPKLPDLVETFVDSTLLSVLITPSLYWFLYLPLVRQISERSLIEKELRQSQARLEQQTQQLQQAPQLLQADKMASLGQLVAGVAHEINNPVNFIYANLTHLNDYIQALLAVIDLYQQRYSHLDPEIAALIKEKDLDFAIEDLPKLLSSMTTGTERIREIVLSLRNFSRLDEAEMKLVDIHEGIDSTLLLLQHRLKSSRTSLEIKVIKNYGDLPKVECYPGHLNQVFMNIITNAIDEADKYNQERCSEEIKKQPSIIKISTQLNEKWVQISIEDNGAGITNVVKEQLFNPFFTTKPVGKGTGLGLSISYQIVVSMHGGELKCISAPNSGAEFVIEIPFRVDYKQKNI